ncbi:Mov34/MPN/PAD-1 family protein [Thermogemmatispora onikobensis]|uniref:Mov34/MPN/PAD-1 family protein n=1 Tax=Thermogemmatispora onikobensis TaxID=732234 RepID=UPI000853C01F|nr:M67 family metallopeptidase [Thermogemmatispora onikobensis]
MVAEVFVVRIPRTIYTEMVAHVTAGYPNEACGLLASKDGRVVKNYPTPNAAEHPDDFSEISSQDLLRIDKDIETYDGNVFAYYHSHPRSEAYPSARDIEWARRNGVYYIIFSLQYHPEPPDARVFSIKADGSVSEGKLELID